MGADFFPFKRKLLQKSSSCHGKVTTNLNILGVPLTPPVEAIRWNVPTASHTNIP